MKKFLGTVAVLLVLGTALYTVKTSGVADDLIGKIVWNTAELENYTVPESGAGTGYYRHCYEALDDTEKQAYALILDHVREHPEQIRVPELTNEQLDDVFEAILYDNPDLICLGTTCKVVGSGQKFYFVPVYNESVAACKTHTAELLASAVKLAAEASAAGGAYNQELYVHDYIIEHCAYSDTGSFTESSAYGALVLGKASCAGYAQAFQLIMARLNIDVRLISGKAADSDGNSQSHMWNAVVIGGENYFVDVTWDDPTSNSGETMSHAYFNVTGGLLKATHSDMQPKISCTSTKADYFVHEGLYFTDTGAAFENSAADAIVSAIQAGKETVEFRFADSAVYQRGKDELIGGSLLRRAYEAGGLVNANSSFTVNYVENREMLTLTVILDPT